MRRSPIRRQRPCYTVHRFVFKNQWVRFLKCTWQLNLPLLNFRVPFLIVVFLLVFQASQPIKEPRSTCSVDWQAAPFIFPPPTCWTNSASTCVGLRNLKTEVSHWKRIKCFPLTLRGRNLKLNNQRSVWICVFGKLRQGNSKLIVFWKCFSSSLKRKAGFSNFLRCEERSRKGPFSWQIKCGRRHGST